MKYRIVEKKYNDDTPYYIVDVNRWYGWGVYNQYMYDDVISRVGIFGGFDHVRFHSIEEAEIAIKYMKTYMNARLHSKTIKIVE